MAMAKGKKSGAGAVEEPAQLKKLALAASEHYWARKRADLLLDLANLHDDCSERFWRRWSRLLMRQADLDLPLLQNRDHLRKVWSGTYEDAGFVLAGWVRQATLRNRQSWVISSWFDGTYHVTPNYCILPLSLAVGLSELKAKMAVCANPECPQPFFLKGRKSQRFCDRPACSAYGQRQHKKKWWNEHGREWKKRRAAS
jgi:hypothetical protein